MSCRSAGGGLAIVSNQVAGPLVHTWVHRTGQRLYMAMHLMHMMWRHGSHGTTVPSSKLSRHRAVLPATLSLCCVALGQLPLHHCVHVSWPCSQAEHPLDVRGSWPVLLPERRITGTPARRCCRAAVEVRGRRQRRARWTRSGSGRFQGPCRSTAPAPSSVHPCMKEDALDAWHGDCALAGRAVDACVHGSW